MRWYKEERFLVMMKDMKYKDALWKIRELLKQAPITYGGVRFMIRPSWQCAAPDLTDGQEEKTADWLTRTFPWLKEYEISGNGEDGTDRRERILTNLVGSENQWRQPDF